MSKNLTARSLAFLISAVTLSACGSSTALSPTPTPKVSASSMTASASTVSVPWINKPATIPTTTVVTTPIPAACKPGDLIVGAASFGFATAQEGWRVPVTNTGTKACSLPDYLSTVTAVGPNGTRVTFSNGPLIQPASPVTIPPEGKVTFLIVSRAWCDSAGLILPSQHYGSIELALPTGTLDLSNLSLKLCNSQIFSGLQEPVSALVPAPGSVASLIPHLEIPKTVKAGSLLHYQVVLENQSYKAVDLQPCPVYQEGITALGAPIKTSSQILELNCTTIHLIKPHQKITYEMVITVPSGPGPAKFIWQILPGGPYTGTALTTGQ